MVLTENFEGFKEFEIENLGQFKGGMSFWVIGTNHSAAYQLGDHIDMTFQDNGSLDCDGFGGGQCSWAQSTDDLANFDLKGAKEEDHSVCSFHDLEGLS